MKVLQRDIIELNYELPNGKFKVNPALVISNSNVVKTEDISMGKIRGKAATEQVRLITLL